MKFEKLLRSRQIQSRTFLKSKTVFEPNGIQHAGCTKMIAVMTALIEVNRSKCRFKQKSDQSTPDFNSQYWESSKQTDDYS